MKKRLFNEELVNSIVLLLAFLFLSSCATAPDVKNISRAGGTYVVASWYGKKFNGRPTASGEKFDMYGMTCAHRTLAFGTKLRITNPDNKKSVIVRVNDRGPFIRGRDLDLSYGAAKEIGIVQKGVGRVMLEHVPR